jgi:hypothetical protein
LATAPFVPPFHHPAASSLTALRRHAFDEGDEHVDCGSLVVRAPRSAGPSLPFPLAESEDPWFDPAQTKQFLEGGPVTFGWVTESPNPQGGDSVYVYCWVTLGD